jgi:uncharacterized membrane protein
MKSSRLISRIGQQWFLIFSLIFGIYVGLPFLAPIFMRLGLEFPAKAVYFLYSFLCHQLPQRSFFLLGPKGMYSLAEIQSAWQYSIDLFILRQFNGSPEMGWKVAWSDRMVSMYTSILFFAWVWYPFRRKLKALPVWGFLLMLLPMALDGSTHLISDFAGMGQGFRDSNAWLATLTNHTLPSTFYIGDALGSFNSWMRLITGILFGLGLVWFGFPYLEDAFTSMTGKKDNKHLNPELVKPPPQREHVL